MSHIQYIDELTREYLLFRGFCNTLKAFDAELKADKDKGFRVDKIVEQIVHYITAYDLISLKELWTHLDQRMFSKLEHQFTPAIRKLETSVLKLYLVNTATTNKPDKMIEFFNKFSSELQGQPEWKDWFALPYMKNPEESPIFAVYFTRHWQDTLLASLHNFLAIIFQSMPLPTLASFEEEATRMKRLTEENDMLRARLAALGASESETRGIQASVIPESAASELMDDFYIIAQEAPSSESQTNPFKTLMRNIGGIPTSPILGRKQQTQSPAVKKVSSSTSVEEKRSSSKTRQSTHWTGGNDTAKRDSKTSQWSKEVEPVETTKNAEEGSPFLLLSQETHTEHRAAITQCRFNSSGSLVASGDADGVVKVWSTSPSPKTTASFTCKSSVVALDWLGKHERFFVLGTRSGSIHLCDSAERKVVWEVGNQAGSPLKDARVLHLCCNPTDTQFVCSVATRIQSGTVAGEISAQGKLLLFDIKTRKLERSLPLVSEGGTSSSVLVGCCTFNHNGQLLVAGASDGVVRIFDLRRAECVDSWLAHLGSVLSLQLSVDFTSCYTLGQDGKFCQRSLNQSGHRVWETTLAEPLAGGVHGQLFTFDQSGRYVLMCGRSGEAVFQVAPQGLIPVLSLGSTGTPSVHATAVDWCSANDCSTCLAGLADGRLKVSTLLQQ